MSSWADAVENEELKNKGNEDAPPPGFEPRVDDITKALGGAKVSEPEEVAGDAPDITLGKDSGLTEDANAEITTVLSDDSTPYTSAQKFEDLSLTPELLKGLYTEMKFERPSRIQAKTLPMVLTPPYKHLIAQAHNGSGKTTCFVLAMLSRVDPRVARPQAICVCPVRELAVQNLQVLAKMGKYTGIRATCTASDDGPDSSRQPITDQVVIGTHGKLKNWMTKRRTGPPILPIEDIKILVFDEADVMMDEHGQKDDSIRMIRDIIRAKKDADLQILLFSATFNDKVKAFVERQLPSANKVFVPREQLSLDKIKQYRVQCPDVEAKHKFLRDLFPLADKLCQTIIFVKTRASCRSLFEMLKKDGYPVSALEGSMEGSQRDRIVSEFREGKTKIMVATDVLSRGFDCSQISLVVNFDPPVDERRDERNQIIAKQPAFETYLHRIGRSGRFGRKGAAFNLWARPDEKGVLDEIIRYFEHEMQDVKPTDEASVEKILREAGLIVG